MKGLLAVGWIGMIFAGCSGVSGYYNVDAYNESGELLTKNVRFTTDGSGVYTTVNGMCSAYPKAVVIVRDTKTGEQLKGISPHRCR
ncbi:MAG: hypothetical protein ACOZBX_08060 [Campylobacterota bacterium]